MQKICELCLELDLEKSGSWDVLRHLKFCPLKVFNPSDDELTRKLSSVDVLVDGQKLVLSFRPLCDFVPVRPFVCLFFWSAVAESLCLRIMLWWQCSVYFGMIWYVFFFLSSARKLTEAETTVISACIPGNAKVQAGKCITLEIQNPYFFCVAFGLSDSEGLKWFNLWSVHTCVLCTSWGIYVLFSVDTGKGSLASDRVQVVFSMKPTVECASAKTSGFSRDELFDVKIPDGVTEVGDVAFDGCSRLLRVSIPNSVKKIGHNAFEDCSALTSVTIPDSVIKIGVNAFKDCVSLTRIIFPQSVTRIDEGAFEGCSSLTSVVIPRSVTKIDEFTFSRCKSLTNLRIPNSVREIGGAAFADCSSLTSVSIPDSVTEIDDSAFYGCSSLKNVTIGHSVTRIGPQAFEDCSSLKSVRIPYSVMQIGSYAFASCSSVTSVAIPNVQTRICAEAFRGCKGLPFFLRVKRKRYSWNRDALEKKNGAQAEKVPLLFLAMTLHERTWIMA